MFLGFWDVLRAQDGQRREEGSPAMIVRSEQIWDSLQVKSVR